MLSGRERTIAGVPDQPAATSEDLANRRARQAATFVAVLGLIIIFLPASFHGRDVFSDPFDAGVLSSPQRGLIGR